MRITDAVIAGTLFETLWDILSSRVALMMYFILLFASIAGMIVAVMKLTTEQSAKQASDGTGAGDGTEDGDTGLKAEAADGAEGGMLELIDDDDITSRFHTLIQYDRAALRYVPPKHDDAITLPMIRRMPPRTVLQRGGCAQVCRGPRRFASDGYAGSLRNR